jgi:hypothetical protein
VLISPKITGTVRHASSLGMQIQGMGTEFLRHWDYTRIVNGHSPFFTPFPRAGAMEQAWSGAGGCRV